MSVAEIKTEIRRMSAEERKEIARAIAEIEGAGTQPAVREVSPNDPAFLAAKEKIFREHHDLFRRLAE